MLDVQEILQSKLDGDDQATCFESAMLVRGAMYGLALKGGGNLPERQETLRRRMQERGLAPAEVKTVKDVMTESFVLMFRFPGVLKVVGAGAPEDRLTIPTAAVVEEATRLFVEAFAPWTAWLPQYHQLDEDSSDLDADLTESIAATQTFI